MNKLKGLRGCPLTLSIFYPPRPSLNSHLSYLNLLTDHKDDSLLYTQFAARILIILLALNMPIAMALSNPSHLYWKCHLRFDLKGYNQAYLFNALNKWRSETEYVHCQNVTNPESTVMVPVQVEFSSEEPGRGATERDHLTILADSIDIETPEQLLGSYINLGLDDQQYVSQSEAIINLMHESIRALSLKVTLIDRSGGLFYSSWSEGGTLIIRARENSRLQLSYPASREL